MAYGRYRIRKRQVDTRTPIQRATENYINWCRKVRGETLSIEKIFQARIQTDNGDTAGTAVKFKVVDGMGLESSRVCQADLGKGFCHVHKVLAKIEPLQ